MSQDRGDGSKSIMMLVQDPVLSKTQKNMLKTLDDSLMKSQYIKPEKKMEVRKGVAEFIQKHLQSLENINPVNDRARYDQIKQSLEERIGGFLLHKKYRVSDLEAEYKRELVAKERERRDNVAKEQLISFQEKQRVQKAEKVEFKARVNEVRAESIKKPVVGHEAVDNVKIKSLDALRVEMKKAIDKTFGAVKKDTWGLHSVGLGSKYYWKEKQAVVDLVADQIIAKLSQDKTISSAAVMKSQKVVMENVAKIMNGGYAVTIAASIGEDKYKNNPNLVKQEFEKVAQDIAGKVVTRSGAALQANQVVLSNAVPVKSSKAPEGIGSRVLRGLQGGMLGR